MSTFVGNPGYRSLNVKSDIDLFLPKVKGKPVVNFSKTEGDVVAARFTPAVAKDVVTVWDRSGNLVFNKRVDETGSGGLGGPFSPIVVNKGTIKQWGEAYLKALDQILVEMKTTLR